MIELLARIEVQSTVSWGKPVIKGTRHSIDNIFEHLACGGTIEDYLESFPQLKREDILGAFAHAALVFRKYKNLTLP
jgi:uncharacterized protein (DUF433 family)